MNYRIIKTRSGKYFIQQKFLWLWMIVRPSGGPIFMDSLYHAELALREIKRYRAGYSYKKRLVGVLESGCQSFDVKHGIPYPPVGVLFQFGSCHYFA